jgi:protein-glucosylgalactosylhydroxylysine glucosidase
MRISRRSFLAGLGAASALSRRARGSVALIDRAALVARYNPTLSKLDPLSPFSLGNGEFAFTSDITGLQTFPEAYQPMPLCTLSQWGWHTFPRPANLDSRDLKLTSYESHGRQVGYATSPEGQTELFNWLRENPHRLNLGRIGLRLTLSNQTER